MSRNKTCCIIVWSAAVIVLVGAASPVLAAPPKASEALALMPIQPHIEFARPAKDEVDRCTVRADKFGGGTAWFVRDPQGQLIRRFADSNGDNVVDQWSYFRDGLEVYRDIDSDFNGHADQYRWFNSAGTRWGEDDDQDGKIDRWRQISAQEVAEELVTALKHRDSARFALLLPDQKELQGLGLGPDLAKQIAPKVEGALTNFNRLARRQKTVDRSTNYVDFGAGRPATVPAGTNGSTKDLTVYENVSALVQNGSDHEQVFLGTLVALGDSWKLLEAPSFDDSSSSGVALNEPEAMGVSNSAVGAPTEEMQQLMERLQELDAQASRLSPAKQSALTGQRAKLLRQLAEITPDPQLRNQWYEQLADMVSAAVQTGGYEEGVKELESLARQLDRADASENVVAHVTFRKMLAEYMLAQQQPEANLVKIQEKWLADLEDFADQFPNSSDAAEAQLQLAMSQEFSGEADEAKIWYERIVSNFPGTERAQKATGALRRLDSEGKRISLRGQALRGGEVDLSAYRGKLVLVQYWATWCEPCKDDMRLIKELYTKNARRGFEVIGVCLDDDPGPAKRFATEAKLPWKNVYESGGLNSRLANELGVMTLPLMLLVDDKNQVVRRSIHGAELEDELKRLLR